MKTMSVSLKGVFWINFPNKQLVTGQIFAIVFTMKISREETIVELIRMSTMYTYTAV